MSIVYREGHVIDLEQLAALFDSTGWHDRAADRARLRQQLVGAMFVVSAWEGNVLAGFEPLPPRVPLAPTIRARTVAGRLMHSRLRFGK